jgi:ligand-binding sensor protein
MWQKIMDTLKQVTGFEAHIITPVGLEVTKAHERCELCRLFRGNNKGANLCDQDNVSHAEEAIREGRPIQYLCHTGQVNYAIPIQIAGQKRVCLIGEHVLISAPDPDKYRKFAERISVDSDELIKVARMLQVIPNCVSEGSREIIENLLARLKNSLRWVRSHGSPVRSRGCLIG